MEDFSRIADWLLARVDEYAQRNRQVIVEDLQQILRFKTVSGEKTDEEIQAWRNGIRDGFQWLAQRARENGLAHRYVEDKVLVLEQVAAGQTLGVLLHLDVVPPGEGWTHLPFGGEIHDDVVYGRGCQDDKGPVIQMLHALAAVKAMELPFRRSVRLIIGSEEETGVWADVKRYLELERAPDFSIVPDGSFPIVNGEKGMIDIRISSTPSGDEDGEIRLISAAAGVRANVVPPLAEVVLQCQESQHEFLKNALEGHLRQHPDAKAELRLDSGPATVVFHGKNAHGSTPWEGQNAGRDALRFLATLPLQGPRGDFARLLSTLIADDEGHALEIANSHDFIKQTTQSLGILKIDAGVCEAVLNIRHTPPQTVALILDRVVHALRTTSDSSDVPQAEIASRTHEPLFVDPARYPEYFRALEIAYGRVTGREATHGHTGGTTFAKAFPNAMCFGPTDPADEAELAHQADERIAIDHLLRNVKIYAMALSLLALDLTGLEG